MTKIVGQRGEAVVVSYLQNQGFKILAQNYQKFFGEIDIIAQRDNILCFIEVKTRKSTLVSMHELVTPIKQRKIILVAKTFISSHRSMPENMIYRFDVALVHLDGNDYKITYIPNAFSMAEY